MSSFVRSRDSSVGTEILLYSEMFISAVGPTEPSIWWDPLSRVNQQGREVVKHLYLAPSLRIHAASIPSRQISFILRYFLK